MLSDLIALAFSKRAQETNVLVHRQHGSDRTEVYIRATFYQGL